MASDTHTVHSHLQLTVITPARAVLNADVDKLIAPAFDGEVGVYPGHAPMLALLGTGELRAQITGGAERHFAIRGGFLQVNHNKVTVLTPESASAEEIKPEQLAEEAQKLGTEHPTKLDERDALENKKNWLKLREKVAGKK
jgi:F-type H+-transporting ATPase subunit epsilon